MRQETIRRGWLLGAASATAVVLAFVLVACGGNGGVELKEGPNLIIWWPNSLQVTDDTHNEPTYDLKLTVINFGTQDATPFDVECSAVGVDSQGGSVPGASPVTLQQGGLSLVAFSATDVTLPPLRWPSPGPLPGRWKIDCTVDAANNIVELQEGDNTKTMFFEGYCTQTVTCTKDPQITN